MPDVGGVFTRTDGTFTGSTVWTQEATANQLVTAAHFDTHDQDIATALNNRVFKDGTTTGIINLQLTGTVNSSTGVISIGSTVFANMLGTNNVFIAGAGNFSLTGVNNVFVGSNIGTSLTNGNANTSVGSNSFQGCTSGTQNTCVGASALISVTSNSSNCAFGYEALQQSTDGANTAVGAQALQVANASNAAALNCAFGYASGIGLTAGIQNTLIGAQAGSALTSGSQNIALGYNVGLPSNSANGQINVGCTIFGTGATGTGTTAGTGKIGINDNAPTYTLDVKGGDFGVMTAGNGLRVAEGANAKQGTAILVAGSKVVSNTAVTANSRIFITSQADGGTPGFLRVSARTAGTSFTVTSSNGSDTSTFAYQIFEPS